MTDASPLLTYKKVAARLGVSDRTVFTLVALGKLKAVRFGRTVRVDPCDLEAFIQESKSGEGVASAG